jgi:hypothetical protein
VIRAQPGGQHAVGNVLGAATFDHAARAHSDAIRIQQQRDHHRRVIGRPAVPVVPIGLVKRDHVQLLDHLDQKPRQVVGGQPVPHIRRHQELSLIAINAHEVEPHQMILPCPGEATATTRLCATASSVSTAAGLGMVS